MARMLSATRGQASVEIVALLPILLVIVAVGWQAAVAGQAWWMAAAAARAAARADAIGGDPRAAARAVLRPSLRAGLTVTRLGDDGDEGVRVRVRIPRLLGVGMGRASASARMERQR